MSDASRPILSGVVAFLVSSVVTLLFSRNRSLALKLGILSGGATAGATWLATTRFEPDARPEPIRVEVESPDEN